MRRGGSSGEVLPGVVVGGRDTTRTNLVRGSECLRPAARGVVRRAARSALRRRALLQTRTQAEYLVLWFLALPARYYAPTTQQISALVRPVLLRYLPVPLRISPYLPAAPRISPHLPVSVRVSAHIPPYPAADTAKISGHTRMLRQ